MLCARWMQITSRKARRSSGPESNQSPSEARALLDTVDRVSETIGRTRSNRAIMRSVG